MFDSLSDRLSGVFRKFHGRARLDESNIQEALREVRLALLEADVNFRVVKDFIEQVRARCLDAERAKNLDPAQQVIKVVNEELISLLGGEAAGLNLSGKPPHVIMLVGLQGSGKTTSTGKLAYWLKKQKHKPYFASTDVYRPAAIEQLSTLAAQLGAPCYPATTLMAPVDIATAAVREAAAAGCDVVLLDTAGRLHIDEPLMRELTALRERVRPQEILFVADAMTGQDAVTVAGEFDKTLDITGVVLTKMDGDARGGAALSIKSITGKSIKFVGVGEKVSELELFIPDRIAGRILGMGDMLTLIEKAQDSIQTEEAEELARKFQKAEFNFEDFRLQMRRMKKLGSLEGLLKLIPGMGEARRKIGDMSLPDKEMKRVEAIINSMTAQERLTPKIINSGRKQRIAKGSGVTTAQVNQLLKQFDSMRSMMQKLTGGGGKMPRGMPGLGGNMPRLPGKASLSTGMGLPGINGSEGGTLAPISDMEQKKIRQKRKEERKRKKKGRK